MKYTCAEEIRVRANRIGRIINEVRDYGRRPLPEKYTDLEREWCELADVWFDLKRLKDLSDIKEATIPC